AIRSSHIAIRARRNIHDDFSLWHDTTGMWGDSHSHASSCGSRGDGRCRKGRRFGSGQFATAHPEIDCEGDTDERQSGAEFSDEVLGAPGVCGHWIEKALNEEIMAGVQQDTGPKAS